MQIRTAFLKSKTSTPEASTQGRPCSFSAKPNRIRSRSETSVLTSGTCGRKLRFVSAHSLLSKGQNAVNMSNGDWCRVDRAAVATSVGVAARHSLSRALYPSDSPSLGSRGHPEVVESAARGYLAHLRGVEDEARPEGRLGLAVKHLIETHETALSRGHQLDGSEVPFTRSDLSGLDEWQLK